jgi:sarcosine oxidase, subunit alpha
MCGYRLLSGGRVDRSKPVRFTFDGQSYSGCVGDTLASALLANGVTLFGRSFKYHRPRGLLAAGSEKPNALVAIDRGPQRFTPNLRATGVEVQDGLNAVSQNRWPSLKRDIGAINDRLGMFCPPVSETGPSCGRVLFGTSSMNPRSAKWRGWAMR